MIKLQHISKSFGKGRAGEIKAVQDISVELVKGTFTIIVGANGSGKSTLLNIISGTETATEGSIYLDNKDITTLPEYKRSKWVARVFQNPVNGVAAGLTILENFRLAALRASSKNLLSGITRKFEALVKDKIATLHMGLEDKLHQPMGTLSGGQRQALTLLMSVMAAPNILLLDEPTAALDPRSAAVVMALADELTNNYRLTTLMITHSLKDAHQYGDRIIQMAEGRMIRDVAGDKKKALLLNDLYEWFD